MTKTKLEQLEQYLVSATIDVPDPDDSFRCVGCKKLLSRCACSERALEIAPKLIAVAREAKSALEWMETWGRDLGRHSDLANSMRKALAALEEE